MTSIAVDHLTGLVGNQVTSVVPVGGGDICHAFRADLADGRHVFVKTLDSPDKGFFETEANGLRWLGNGNDGAPVPGVIAVDDTCLVLEWVDPGAPSAAMADRFGRALAETHRKGADVFGAHGGDGWIGTLPLPGGPWPEWPELWAHGRLAPYLKLARDNKSIGDRDAADVERVIERLPELAGPAEQPSRIHGDLWAGNVLWGADGRGWLIDPAAHGGHRETDLAMLALFGLRHIDRVLASYHEAWPLADGWRHRVALHQMHPVLVHAVLFGGSYGPQAGHLARQALAAA
ncbi:fructosamine kinase family protein [Phytoactinopolyspora halotolerans]|uniref:Phosphotransferase n=1 Tax=Phytoactinopolyspora halotolerans TaxID=1981512 RepID=A0A6L9S362_9ACTN|nr:fructosamine kinase family protein [Phytoactinopolyspora halotolerans]NED99001.1 phosphotransferase [Phytoactinopolyspora halotolerans]